MQAVAPIACLLIFIRAGAGANMDADALDAVQGYSVKEGKVSYRLHKTLERNRKAVAVKKAPL